MDSDFREHSRSVGLSTCLHIALVAALTLGLSFSDGPRYPEVQEQVAIQATVVDESRIREELARLEQQKQAEVLRQQEQERIAREQAEAARRELEQEQRRLEEAREESEQAVLLENQRLEDLRFQREEAERLQAETERQRVEEETQRAEEERLRAEEEERLAREREAEAERQRLAEEQRQREEQERLAQEAEEAQRRAEIEAAEARQRAEMEAELQRVLAVEDERQRAEQSGLLDQYIRLIVNRIEQNWIRPASAVAGLECEVRVTQIPSGDIVDVRIGNCNGDDAVIRSIEAAVLRSSPLPRPPLPSLFERTLNVVFTPQV